MPGIRLHITAEGQTEERFVNRVLVPHLVPHSVWADVRCVLTSKDKRAGVEYRGGLGRGCAYQRVKKDICTWMKQDKRPEARFTTMFDLYALPSDFPGHERALKTSDPYERVEILEEALKDDVSREFNDTRFIPYIQLHEFEALLLADPSKLEIEFLECAKPIQRLVDMVAREGGNPELIDDGQKTAPSKRIIAEIPEYEGLKAASGPLVADEIGMAALCARCQHFSQWVDRLVALAQ